GVEVLGLLVHGRDHTVGLAPPKLQALAAATRHFASRATCTGLELARVIGHWTHGATASAGRPQRCVPVRGEGRSAGVSAVVIGPPGAALPGRPGTTLYRPPVAA